MHGDPPLLEAPGAHRGLALSKDPSSHEGLASHGGLASHEGLARAPTPSREVLSLWGGVASREGPVALKDPHPARGGSSQQRASLARGPGRHQRGQRGPRGSHEELWWHQGTVSHEELGSCKAVVSHEEPWGHQAAVSHEDLAQGSIIWRHTWGPHPRNHPVSPEDPGGATRGDLARGSRWRHTCGPRLRIQLAPHMRTLLGDLAQPCPPLHQDLAPGLCTRTLHGAPPRAPAPVWGRFGRIPQPHSGGPPKSHPRGAPVASAAPSRGGALTAPQTEGSPHSRGPPEMGTPPQRDTFSL